MVDGSGGMEAGYVANIALHCLGMGTQSQWLDEVMVCVATLVAASLSDGALGRHRLRPLG